MQRAQRTAGVLFAAIVTGAAAFLVSSSIFSCGVVGESSDAQPSRCECAWDDLSGSLSGDLEVGGSVAGTSLCIGDDCRTTWPSESPWSLDGTAVSYTDGNVGLGTAAPTGPLHIVSGLATSGDTAHLKVESSAAGQTNFLLENTSSTTGWELAVGGSSGIYGPGAFYLFERGQGGRVIVQPGGNVGIGTGTPASKLDVAGGCITGSFCSDARLKSNIRSLSNSSVLKKLVQLEAKLYEWKDRPEQGTRIGVVAQDVEALFPEVVTTGEAGEQKGLSCTGLNALAIEAIKELKAEVDRLRAELDARR